MDGDGIVFLTSLDGEDCARALSHLGAGRVVRNIDALAAAGGRTLLSFATSVIVPKEILSVYARRAYNLHAASPDYPGRDPHHWAIYEGARRYGATLHVMTDKVDDGPIIDVEWFDIAPGTTPEALYRSANEAAFQILSRFGPQLRSGEALRPAVNLRWGAKKRRRADFLAMCRLTPDISREEFERRFHAFDGGRFDNLTVELHGRTFRIEKK